MALFRAVPVTEMNNGYAGPIFLRRSRVPLAEAMRGSMERMHAAMMVAPRGDPDRDFAAMMIPHHQGAVDMAEAELKYGKNERLRRLAQGIIVEQRQEIVVMQGVLAEKNGTLPSDQTPMGDMK